MRIVLFAHGTRGDVWPLVALGAQLRQRDHDVTVGTSEAFRGLVEHAGVRFGRLPVDLTAHLDSAEGQRLLNGGRSALMRDVGRLYARHAVETDEAYEFLGQGVEAVVSNQITSDRAQAVADARRVPMAVAYPMPIVPTSAYGSPMLTAGRLRSPAARRSTHRLTALIWWLSGATETATFRRRLGVSPWPGPAVLRHDHDRSLGLCAWSPSLVPRPADFRRGVHLRGAWQLPAELREATGEGMPTDLAAWISAGDAPVYLGFGSMPVLKPGALLDDIVAVTRQLGVRAVIGADWDDRADLVLPEHVRLARGLDHDRLFPLCVAVVHHGGTGTVAASTRAGCPTLVCSVWADQPWWGERLARLGVGAHLPFRNLNRSRLESALRAVLQPDVRERARVLGEAIRAEGDGLPAAATALDDWLVTAEPTPAARARHRRPKRDGASDLTVSSTRAPARR